MIYLFEAIERNKIKILLRSKNNCDTICTMELPIRDFKKKIVQDLSGFGGRHDISLYANFSKLLGAEKQNLRRSIDMLRKGFLKIGFAGVADHNELFRNAQISIQQFRMLLKKALGPFIKNKEIRTGIIAVIRYDKICLLGIADSIQYPVFHIAVIRTFCPIMKALIAAASARLNFEVTELILASLFHFRHNIIADLFAISTFSRTK